MKNKSLMLFSLLAVMLLLASGCSNSPTGGAVSGKEVVKVGVLSALTGDVATIGESSTKAIELAAEEFNARSKTTHPCQAYQANTSRLWARSTMRWRN